MKDLRVKEEFVRFRALGWSFDRIAAQLNTSKPTLLAWSAELTEEIRDATLLELDALLKQFELGKAARVKRLATLLQKVQSELDKRDFSNVATPALLQMADEVQKQLFSEVNGVRKVVTVGGMGDFDEVLKGKTVSISAID